jgi:hypothetical protein
MEDVTNYINNIGKSRDGIKLDCRLSLAELGEIKYGLEAMVNDGHDSSVLVKLYEDVTGLFNKINYVLDERGNRITHPKTLTFDASVEID